MSAGSGAMLDGPVPGVARDVLGRCLISEIDGRRTGVVITEVEAYGGEGDPASHAFRGPTPRNAVMFGPAGYLYVYRSYGIHWCMNVVVGPEGTAAAVLLRGGRPVEGRSVMEGRRGRADRLTDGPGKLCQALGVTGEHNGVSLVDGVVRFEPWPREEGTVLATPRIGINQAIGRLWRFVLADGD